MRVEEVSDADVDDAKDVNDAVKKAEDKMHDTRHRSFNAPNSRKFPPDMIQVYVKHWAYAYHIGSPSAEDFGHTEGIPNSARQVHLQMPDRGEALRPERQTH